MNKLPIKSWSNVINLGNFDNLIKMNDKSISFGKTRNHNIYENGLWIQMDGKIFYFKAMKDLFSTINDLLGVKITEYFGLPSVKYKVAKGCFNGEEVFGLLSKYERAEGYQYNNLEDIVYSEDSIIERPYNICDLSFIRSFEDAYQGTQLPNQLKTLIIRDFVTNETDRKMSEIHIRKKEGLTEIDKIFDFEKEWNLLGDESSESTVTEDDIELKYKIFGLLTLTEKDYSYLRSDPVFQNTLNKFLELETAALLEQVEIETPIIISQMDYDYYSLYTETMKSKLKKQKIIS